MSGNMIVSMLLNQEKVTNYKYEFKRNFLNPKITLKQTKTASREMNNPGSQLPFAKLIFSFVSKYS